MGIIIKLNGEYITRAGHYVKIIDYNTHYKKPFFGRIKDQAGQHIAPASYSLIGGYSETPHDYDIVKEA